jgi:hypothetical protein
MVISGLLDFDCAVSSRCESPCLFCGLVEAALRERQSASCGAWPVSRLAVP